MIGIIKKTLPPKTSMQEKQGAILIVFTVYVNTVNTDTINYNVNYNIDSNMKTLNYIKVRFKALIYFGLEQTLN